MTGRASDKENEMVAGARAGDSSALEQIVIVLQPRVYRLAVRMLWHPEDAKDATQEILIRVVTSLSTFRAESSLSPWAYRIATNHLLTARRNRLEEWGFGRYCPA